MREIGLDKAFISDLEIQRVRNITTIQKLYLIFRFVEFLKAMLLK